MKKRRPNLPLYEQSSSAKEGMLVITMQNGLPADHDVFTPHRDSHYIVVIPTSGQISLLVDFTEIRIKPPGILLLSPGDVHHVLDATKPKGWNINFDPSLVGPELETALIGGFKPSSWVELGNTVHQQIVTLAETMYEIQKGGQNSYLSRSAYAILTAIFCLVAGARSTTSMGRQGKETRSLLIERQFNQLLEQYYKSWKRPAQYAGSMSISVAHLNDTIKEATGISVSEHIRQRSILEAKRLLYFTDLPVKDIGYELGYNDPIYFSKLFRTALQLTAREFREKFRGHAKR